MAQHGYTSCAGCGRLFKLDSQVEMIDLFKHNCEDDNDPFVDDEDDNYFTNTKAV